MSAVLVAAALVVATGAIAALASTDARLGLVGLAAALVGAGLLADPLPGPAVLGVRLAAALLAVALLRAAGSTPDGQRRIPERGADGRAHLGWPAEALLGVAGTIAGLSISGGLSALTPISGPELTSTSPFGVDWPPSAAALGLALAGAVIAISLPALVSGAGLRRATAIVLALQGALLARIALAGPLDALEEVVLAALLVTVAATAALLASAERSRAEAGPRPA